ncbi:MAG: dockerin type I domain-containing protein, partial [Pirellulales bacterium]|nr:dockerin type I domain-containing protein [Pirellulales bacterium]
MSIRRPNRQTRRPHKTRRPLRAESLEKRQLLAGDIGLHNTDLPTDVNGDGKVTAVDALTVVNHIVRKTNAAEAEQAGENPAPVSTTKWVDVD